MTAYPVASIPLGPIAGLHGGTGTIATTSWVVNPDSVPGAGKLVFLGRDVQVTTFLFQIAADVVPNWFGAAVPSGLTEFGNVHVFFHPTPAQAGYIDADYRTKSGKWPELFYYMERLGNQLCGAGRDQLLVMPFLTEAAKDTGILPGSWSEILPDIATAVRDAVGQPSATPVSVDKVVVSSFSAGMIYSDSFRRRASGLAPVLAEVWDLDGSFSSYYAISGALRSTAGCPVARYDQVPGGDPQTFHVPQPRWSDFIQPPQNSGDVHALIRDFMFLHGAAISTVGDIIGPPDTGTATNTASHTASHTGTATHTGTGTATHTSMATGTASHTGSAGSSASHSGSQTGTSSGTSPGTVVGSTSPSAIPAAPGPATTPDVPGLTPGPGGRSTVPALVPGASCGGCAADASTTAVSAIVAAQAAVATTATTAIAQTADQRRRRSRGGSDRSESPGSGR